MKTDVTNPLDCTTWDDQVIARHGSFFHSSGWARVMLASYGYKPLYFTLSDEERLMALLPVMEVRSLLTGSRGVSLAFSDYCDPIAEDRETFSQLFDQVVDYGKKAGWRFIELRGGGRFLGEAPVYAKYAGHTVELSASEKDQTDRLRDSTLRNIKKAQRAGVEVKITTSFEALVHFYELHVATRKRHGLPPQPFAFFEHLHQFVIVQNRGFIVTASHGGKIVAAGIVVHFGSQGVYKFAASDKKFQHLRANNLVLWEAMKRCQALGCAVICLGRTDLDDEGLLQFKTGWGTVTREISYYRYDLIKSAFIAREAENRTPGNRLVATLPRPLLRSLGNVLYRHMG